MHHPAYKPVSLQASNEMKERLCGRDLGPSGASGERRAKATEILSCLSERSAWYRVHGCSVQNRKYMGSHSTGGRVQEYSIQGYSIQGQTMHKGGFGPPEALCTRGVRGTLRRSTEYKV